MTSKQGKHTLISDVADTQRAIMRICKRHPHNMVTQQQLTEIWALASGSESLLVELDKQKTETLAALRWMLTLVQKWGEPGHEGRILGAVSETESILSQLDTKEG
jgi:hypothetical protein